MGQGGCHRRGRCRGCVGCSRLASRRAGARQRPDVRVKARKPPPVLSLPGTVSSARAVDRGLVEATPAPAAPDENQQKAARTRTPSGTKKPADRSDGDSPPPAAPSPVPPAGNAESAAPQTSHPPEMSEAPPTEPIPADVTVYSSSDPTVQPPVLASPQLPGRFPDDGADGPPMPPMEVDLLVNQDGAVESVKFLNPPQRFQQRMIASAMKAWHYRPAMKDGRPVRFRLRVKLPL